MALYNERQDASGESEVSSRQTPRQNVNLVWGWDLNTGKNMLFLGLGEEIAYSSHSPCPNPPPQCAQHQIWQVSLQQILLCTLTLRLDLTVPSSSIKSEALKEECVNPVWRVALPTQSVDAASQPPFSYFLVDMWKHLHGLAFIRVHSQECGPHIEMEDCCHLLLSMSTTWQRLLQAVNHYHLPSVRATGRPQCMEVSLGGMCVPMSFPNPPQPRALL